MFSAIKYLTLQASGYRLKAGMTVNFSWIPAQGRYDGQLFLDTGPRLVCRSIFPRYRLKAVMTVNFSWIPSQGRYDDQLFLDTGSKLA
ncbi:MAG: hypothetical protein ACJA0N_000039 [Pseudohongiellaceae bacterium]|jgi:hypothetical protein